MTGELRRVLGLIVNQPLCITEPALSAVMTALAPRLPGYDFDPIISRDVETRKIGELAPAGVAPAKSRPAYDVQDGIAIIPVMGELVPRAGYLDAASGVTSYASIQSALRQALSDASVRGILLDIDSPGGTAAGMIDAADAIRRAGQAKPVWSVAAPVATSAAYLLASSASRVLSVRGGQVGSIGALAVHTDRTGELSKRGIVATIVRSGERKAVAHPFEALDQRARDFLQEIVDRTARDFGQAVAERRGADAKHWLDLQGDVIPDDMAARIGLIDDVAGLDQAREQLAAHLSKSNYRAIRSTTSAAVVMDEVQDTVTVAAEPQPVDVEAIRREAIAAERRRIAAIVEHGEARGRENLAHHLAFRTDASADEAAAILAAAPRSVEPPGAPRAADDDAGLSAIRHEMMASSNPAIARDHPEQVDSIDAFARRVAAAARHS